MQGLDILFNIICNQTYKRASIFTGLSFVQLPYLHKV
jgi:hypothetical protein